MRIGVDAGGTFTDFVVLAENGRLSTFKLRSDPVNPARVILAGLERVAREVVFTGARVGVIDVVHGSTVATNALLERKGARTSFVTTAGFEDLLEIGRQNRAELYNLMPAPRRPLVPREHCYGVKERAWHTGEIAERPSQAELKRLATRLRHAGIQSIAVCFLHSYRNSANERAVKRALERAGVYVCASHEISPEFREYERASTTAVNAYVGPLMDAYLRKLEHAQGFRISVMQSNGGFLAARDAARHAVRTVLSGPAGGVVGAMETARAGGFKNVLGFDMGGTSTDVSIAGGAARETTESAIDGFPIRVPMLDIHTVGAGGGSIARVDAGGLLRVGPESAGADPGPACYGQGDQATVTDAHVVLGRIDALLGGTLALDATRAAEAVGRVAKQLKLPLHEAAAGIVRVANANMERAIRVVSVERGYDPREFALVAFGGCGGLHACEMAAELGIRTVLVPEHAGVLSALGMLMADAVRDYAVGVLGVAALEPRFVALEKRARRESSGATIERSADVRYRGQSYELNVPWDGSRTAALFHREHERLYGYSHPHGEVEVVTLRVRARTVLPHSHLRRIAAEGTKAGAARRRAWTGGTWKAVPSWARAQLTRTRRLGPALVIDYGATTLVPAGWRFHLDAAGNVVVQHG
ncbi:MAG TPA: hydantoinase/oxoprolinase family protein [Bryobacteraceae bacterium]|nr:hydantoinase/oxoprolinase family protein [Bryobacteraceae bacterium]